jgi:hypothetical protein
MYFWSCNSYQDFSSYGPFSNTCKLFSNLDHNNASINKSLHRKIYAKRN